MKPNLRLRRFHFILKFCTRTTENAPSMDPGCTRDGTFDVGLSCKCFPESLCPSLVARTSNLVREYKSLLETPSRELRVSTPERPKGLGPYFADETKRQMLFAMQVFRVLIKASPVFDVPETSPLAGERVRPGIPTPTIEDYLGKAFVGLLPSLPAISACTAEEEVLSSVHIAASKSFLFPWSGFNPQKGLRSKQCKLSWDPKHESHVFNCPLSWLETLPTYKAHVETVAEMFEQALDAIQLPCVIPKGKYEQRKGPEPSPEDTSEKVCVDASLRVLVMLKNMLVFLDTYLVPGFWDLVPIYTAHRGDIKKKDTSKRKIKFCVTGQDPLEINSRVFGALYKTMFRVAMGPWGPDGLVIINKFSRVQLPALGWSPPSIFEDSSSAPTFTSATCVIFTWLCEELKRAVLHVPCDMPDRAVHLVPTPKGDKLPVSGCAPTPESVRPSPCPLPLFRRHEASILKLVLAALDWLSVARAWKGPEAPRVLYNIAHVLLYMLCVGGGCGCFLSVEGIHVNNPEISPCSIAVGFMHDICFTVSALFTQLCCINAAAKYNRRKAPCLLATHATEQAYLIVTTLMQHKCCMESNGVATVLVHTLAHYHRHPTISQTSLPPMATCMSMYTTTGLNSKGYLDSPFRVLSLADILGMRDWHRQIRHDLLAVARTALRRALDLAKKVIEHENDREDVEVEEALEAMSDYMKVVPQYVDVHSYFNATKDPEPIAQLMDIAIQLRDLKTYSPVAIPDWLLDIARQYCEYVDEGHIMVVPKEHGDTAPSMGPEEVDRFMRMALEDVPVTLSEL
jgi:hypothetical protein